jgi:hypothetical protein
MLWLRERDRQTARASLLPKENDMKVRSMGRSRVAFLGLFLAGFAIAAEACGSSDDASSATGIDAGGGSDGSLSDASTPNEASTGGDGGACARVADPTDDHVRTVLISHPFDAAGDAAPLFEVLSLAIDGTLTQATPPVTFSMGPASTAPIVFTPDGKVALVAQDDGTIGVVRFDAAGPVVVHAAFKGTFYAGAIAIDASGAHAYVLDADTANNGGGVYEVDIACDGTLTSAGLVVPGGTANQMTFVPSTSRAVLAAGGAFNAPDGSDIDLIDFGGVTPSPIASGSGFIDGGAIVSSIAVMPDGKFALAADNGIIVGNRLAAIALPSMENAGILATPNPAAVFASPFGNSALILNSDGTDAIRFATYASDAATPFSIVGEIAYVNAKPQLPSFASVIERGTLKGRVLVAENVAVRQVAFEPDAGVVDLSLLNFDHDGGLDEIVGVIGVAP